MKRIMASVGVVALGAAVMQTSNAQSLGSDSGKAWTVSAALRGFYDDNVNTVHASSDKIDTFGFEVSPSVRFDLPMDQTTVSLAYTLSYLYYDEKPDPNRSSHDSMTHTIAARLLHSFTERTSASISDSFIIGQEPDIIRDGGSVQRISGDNIRNYGSVVLSHQFTPVLGMEFGYDNGFYDYDDEGVGSYSALLDRVEHRIHLDGRWTLANQSVAFLGYAFSAGRYTGDEELLTGSNVFSDSRDYNTHYAYVGLEHTFRPDLVGSLKVGASFYDAYNSPNSESTVSPYVQASLRYTYAAGSTAEIGVTHDRRATDSFSIVGNSITTDSETTLAYGSISHQITTALTGSLMATFQNSTYNGGSLDGDTEQFYILTAALAYQFTPHISGTVSYNFDHLESNRDSALFGNRSYDRNRVFVGAVFTY